MFGVVTVLTFCINLPGVSAHPLQEDETNQEAKESKPDEAFFKLPLDEAALSEHWKQLTDEQVAQVTLRNMQAIVSATHHYWEDHGSLPPAVVPNPDLPEDKRLSGFVLLLPYFDKVSKDILKDDAFGTFAKQLSVKIDLRKAWDDPANADAAKTLVPILLSPSNGDFRDDDGRAVSNFAFVRGPVDQDSGAFTGEVGVTFTTGEKQISDGSVSTFASTRYYGNVLVAGKPAGTGTIRIQNRRTGDVSDYRNRKQTFSYAVDFGNGNRKYRNIVQPRPSPDMESE